MIPVMLAGALYTKLESKIKNGKWLLIPAVLCMTTVVCRGAKWNYQKLDNRNQVEFQNLIGNFSHLTSILGRT